MKRLSRDRGQAWEATGHNLGFSDKGPTDNPRQSVFDLAGLERSVEQQTEEHRAAVAARRSVGLEEGRRRRDEGLARAEGRARAEGVRGRTDALIRARELLRELAIERWRNGGEGTVTSDDAHELLEADGYPDNALGNAIGSLFRGQPGWADTGRCVQSTRASANARKISVWVWNGTERKEAR